MKKYTLTKISEVSENDADITMYNIAEYKIRVANYHGGFKCITVVNESENIYMPEIFCNDDFEGNVFSFDIQTTPYSLPPEEFKKMIKCYEEALMIAETLTREFVKTNGKKEVF